MSVLAELRNLPRPVRFAIEVVTGLFIAVLGAWLAAKTGLKLNAKANGDIRAMVAQERIAAALERAYPPPKPLPRPSLLDAPEAIVKRPGYIQNEDGCREVRGLRHEYNQIRCVTSLPTLGGTARE